MITGSTRSEARVAQVACNLGLQQDEKVSGTDKKLSLRQLK